MPSPIGRKTARSPRKKTEVMSMTVLFCLKIEPKYAGSSTPMQQGANNAAIPAIKAVINAAKIRISMFSFFPYAFLSCRDCRHFLCQEIVVYRHVRVIIGKCNISIFVYHKIGMARVASFVHG